MSTDIKQTITDSITRIADAMNLVCHVELTDQDQNGKPAIVATIHSEDGRFLIGKNGQNLQSLEHVVRAIVLKRHPDSAVSISFDVNDYKKSRVTQVVELARTALNRVRSSRKAQVLAPMSSFERRMVHMELASAPDVITESIGQEPQRRIVIKPYM